MRFSGFPVLPMVAFAMLALTPASASGQAAAPAADPARQVRMRAAVARLAREPGIRDVQRAAVRHFRLQPEVIEGLRSRATGRALLPSLSVGGTLARLSSDRNVDDVLVPLDTTDRLDNTAVGGTAMLEWNLSETVFNPAELQTYALVGYQVEIVKEVTRLYFIRKQLLLTLLIDPPEDARARAALELRIEEFTALIDSYTGGDYLRLLEGSERRGRPRGR